ncbi:hypothetical protein HS041_01740 [Planomonospora sp. ID67723]|uniref:hypothetical protein n=1 Tax=Planomonospora sp. ID67723 TaxID=2738134 RepID=UPI0018C3BBF4|nr:hypothetical protein [Planomonospora sp. ID67723]MBG0826506.1 hypothetical protein [Planomonospora sp. ID67723]
MHRHAEALLANLAAGGVLTGTPPEVPDVPGHWLSPALNALTALIRGEDALEHLGHAAQRDAQKTALFLCLALAVAGQGDRIHASWFGTAFGELRTDRPVTHGQRALWLAAARGAYGPAGKIFVLRKLDAASPRSPAAGASASAGSPDTPEPDDPGRWLRALTPDEPSIVVPPSLTDFPELAEFPELARPVHAAAQLARLRSRCVEITSAGEIRERDGDGKLVNLSRTPATAWAEEEPLAVLRRLAGFGGPEGPMSSLDGHLLADLRPGSDPRLAAIALHVAAPSIRNAAERLARATQSAPPDSVTLSLLGHQVVLRPEGPDPASFAAAEERVVAEGVPARGRPWPGYALLALGAILVVVASLASAFFAPATIPAAVLAAVLAGAGAHLIRQRRRQERADAEYVTSQLVELRELAEGAVWALHEYAREADKRAQTAAADLAELTRLLRRGPRAG